MENLIKNAKSQFEKFGNVRATYYADYRDCENSENLIMSLEEAIDKIVSVMTSNQDEDIHLPHANCFNS